ncbi:hypothetical protein CONLIGDRAFT_154172 [Coniochaeta ligniaria NRRL 30616]|uniref:Uncharacterized protein n=1 Tax=Coniochaeta ligniaria NRRL 30616 TaxID=1408157 RepID=A0A1J7IZB9_9PEZI|nr:hypothetical protein CONLIGDRAFT_154172 [Coniochaeta ligniaria NRRL 30616]
MSGIRLKLVKLPDAGMSRLDPNMINMYTVEILACPKTFEKRRAEVVVAGRISPPELPATTTNLSSTDFVPASDIAELFEVEMDDGPSGGVVGMSGQQPLHVIGSNQWMVGQLFSPDSSQMRAFNEDMPDTLDSIVVAPIAYGRGKRRRLTRLS